MDLAALLLHLDVARYIEDWGYLAVAVIIGLESLGVPLPGETTLLAAAILAGAGHQLHIVPLIASAATGAILGDNVGYWIGRELGFRLLMRYGRRVGIGDADIKVGRYVFQRHGGKVVFFGRFVALLRVLAALLAGVNRLAWTSFLWFNAAGAVVWATIYGTIGYTLGNSAHHLSGYMNMVGIAAALVAIAGGYVLSRRHYGKLQEAAERAMPGPLRP